MIVTLQMLAITIMAMLGFLGSANNNHESLLNGLWEGESLRVYGETAPVEAARSIRVFIKNDRMFIKVNLFNRRETECLFKIDETKSPKQIDITSADDSSKSALGIYELNGTTLKVCLKLEADGKRPDGFAAEKDSQTVLMEFKKSR